MSSDNLRERTIRGSLAAGGVVAILRPINIVATIFLARLLDPSDFGFVALAMLLVSSSYIFTNLGMGPALVHTSADETKAAQHAFVLTMISGLGFTLALLMFARPIAVLLGDESATSIIRWLSSLLMLESLFLVPNALLRRHLMFERVSGIRIVAEVAYVLVSVTMALAGLGYWSLVIATIFTEFLYMILSWVLCPNLKWLRPQRWDNRLASSLLRYGVQGMGAGIVTYFHAHTDDWMVGRFLGVTQLGYYSKAYDLSQKTLVNLGTDVIGSVFFPAYRKVQDDRIRLARMYLKSLSFITLLMSPVAFGMFIVAPIAVPVLLGSKWNAMIPVLQVFSLMVLTRPISANTHPLFMAVGKPIYSMWAGTLLICVMLPLAIVGLRWGITGVALAVAVSHTVGMFFNTYQANTLLPSSARRTLTISLPPLAAGTVMMLVVQICKAPLLAFLGDQVDAIYLFVLILIGAVAYTVAIGVFQRRLLVEFLTTVRSAIRPQKISGSPV